MKKYLLTSLFLLVGCSFVWSQTEKGRWQIGSQIGNLRYQNEGQYAQKSFSGTITPTLGYFVAKNLLLGTGIPVSYSTSYLKSPDFKSYQLIYGLSPFVNYYFGKGPLKPYIGAAYSYSRTINYYRSFLNGESKATGYSTTIAPHAGVAYFITRNIGLNVGLSYTIQHMEVGFLDNIPANQQSFPPVDSKFFSMDFGFQLYFGR